jgi:hypothetical protein
LSGYLYMLDAVGRLGKQSNIIDQPLYMRMQSTPTVCLSPCQPTTHTMLSHTTHTLLSHPPPFLENACMKKHTSHQERFQCQSLWKRCQERRHCFLLRGGVSAVVPWAHLPQQRIYRAVSTMGASMHLVPYLVDIELSQR